MQHAAKNANGALELSVANVFNVHVLASKLIRIPRAGQRSHQLSSSQPQNLVTRHRDILSWLFRPFVLENVSPTNHRDRNSETRCSFGCGLSYPTDALRMVQYDIQVAAASTCVLASSTSTVGSVWGPVLRTFAKRKRRFMDRIDHHWCWVSQNKVGKPRLVCVSVHVYSIINIDHRNLLMSVAYSSNFRV